MLRPGYPIETERLRLRPFRADDLDAVAAIHGSPEIARYLYWAPRRRAEVRELLARRASWTVLEREGDAINLAVELAATGELVGDVTLIWRSAEHRQGEIGYIVAPPHQGNGYATEMTRALLALAFEERGLHRVYGRIDGRNVASARVLERLGMRREAQLVENERIKGEWTDEVVYALLAREWRTYAATPASRERAGSGSASNRSA